jgi:hypothetical protein
MELREAMFKCAEALEVIPEMICVRPCLSGNGKYAAFVNSDIAFEGHVAFADEEIAAVNKLRRFHSKN